MKRKLPILLAIPLTIVFFLVSACSPTGWKGFEREDLSQYLILGEYRALTYTPVPTAVSEDEVDRAIGALLDARAVLRATEEPLKAGMVVAFDRFCFLNGESRPDLSEENGSYLCGGADDPVVSALLEQMTGMTLGDTGEWTVTLPAGYIEPGSEACEAVYRVTVRALYERDVPELTDGLASRLRAGVGTAEELRTALRNELSEEKQAAARERIETELWDRVTAASEMVKKPYDLYQEYYTALYGTYEALAEASSSSVSDYLASQSMTLSALEARLMEQANDQVKEALIRHEIAKREGLSCPDSEILAYAVRQAATDGLFSSGAEYIEYYGKDAVAEDLLAEKVLARIVELAVPA